MEPSRNLVDIFSEAGLEPKQMSNGQFRMKCPFRDNHKDGSGQMSFFVTPDMNSYHCFSCHEHGNLIRLLTTVFGVNYFEAVGMVRLSDHTPEKKDFDLDIFWDVDQPPEEFLSRGLTEETLKHFRIGTDPDGRIVIPYYKDFNNPTLLLGYQTREYVRGDRIVRNNKGFDKETYLYNYCPKEFSYVVVVEGQSDVLRLYQFGYNASALMGSHISDAQVKMLSKFDKVYLALDNDVPGRRATEEVYALLKDHVNIRLVPYTTKDPCECTVKREWETAFVNSTDYMQYALEMSIGWEDYLEMKDDVLRQIRKRDGLRK